ncbi:hypothetical protein AB4Y32_05360 [Paraburkholderia phymatum]|uniref:Uncharacterized protein n=1 Tax=Paraburkholderia phymatum TaxID=148447 RepID=A0ACC6TUY5_9BURK
MANQFADSGIGKTEFSDLRPYGYPLFLALVLRIGKAVGLSFSFSIFLAQTCLYLLVSWYFSRIVYKEWSKPIGQYVLLGLFGNILVFPALGIALSDGFSLILQIAIVAIFTRLYLLAGKSSPVSVWLRLFLIGLLTGFAVMVRPGNIHFLLFEAVALVLYSFSLCKMRRGQFIIWLIVAALGFAIAVAPQVIFNRVVFHVNSFLPVYDLQGRQLFFGQQYLKYGTAVNDLGQGSAMPYMSPWASSATGTIAWYFSHPLAGAVTLLAHIFGAVDFDYLFTYVHLNAHSWRWLSFLVSQGVVFWGLAGWTRIYRAALAFEKGEQRDLFRAFCIVSFAYVASWLAVYAPSAVENRYAFPLVTLFLPVALWALCTIKSLRNAGWLCICFGIYLLFSGAASMWLSSLRVLPAA